VILVEALSDLGTVLIQNIERDVVGPGDVRGLEFGRSPHVDNAWSRGRLKQCAKLWRRDDVSGWCVQSLLPYQVAVNYEYPGQLKTTGFSSG
jgi:hypothetical protein